MVGWVPRGNPIRRAHDASYCIQWSADDRILGSAGADGRLQGYETRSGRVQHDIAVTANKEEVVPLTALVWAASKGSDRGVWTAQSNGVIMKYDMQDKRCLHRMVEPDNDIYTLAVSRDGQTLCSGGQDGVIRIYDANSGAPEPVSSIALRGQYEANLHPVRIYCLRFAKHSPSVVAAGGWDGVKMFDVRTPTAGPVRDIFGPYLSGSALDFASGNTMITASSRPENQVEQWDLSTGKKLKDIPCPVNKGRFPFLPSFCAVARVSAGYLALGGGSQGLGSENTAMILDLKQGTLVGQVPAANAKHAFHCCDFNNQDSAVAFGDASGMIHILEKKGK